MSGMSTADELTVHLVYLETLGRRAAEDELADQSTRLGAGAVTAAQLASELRATTEFRKLTGAFGGTLSYDTATWRASVVDAYAPGYFGAFLGNGKIGLRTSAERDAPISQCMIACCAPGLGGVPGLSGGDADAFSSVRTRVGRGPRAKAGNTILSPNSFGCIVRPLHPPGGTGGPIQPAAATGSLAPSVVAHAPEDAPVFQEMDLRSAMFVSSHLVNAYVADAADVCKDEEMQVRVRTTSVPLWQFPYCSLHSVQLQSCGGAGPGSFGLLMAQHTISAPGSLVGVTFSNLVVNLGGTLFPHPASFGDATDGAIRAAPPMYCVVCRGSDRDTGVRVVTVVTYTVRDGGTLDGVATAGGASVRNLGYNLTREDRQVALNRFRVSLPAAMHASVTLDVWTCTMTDADFPDPETEAVRVLIQIASRGHAEVLAEHIAAWDVQWRNDVTIEPKADITVQDLSAVSDTSRAIRSSLFSLYCSVRDDASIEVDPSQCVAIDPDGHLLWSAEMWVVPALLFLRPRAARALLDQRHSSLALARRLAAVHGQRGGRYPYDGETLGYTGMYWEANLPSYVFNTALVAVNVWNYYRVTRDLDWLRRRGYEILSDVADFIDSLTVEVPGNAGTYLVPSTAGVNGVSGENQVLTVYFGRMALRAAVEASYELGLNANQRWRAVMAGLQLPSAPRDGGGRRDTLRVHATYAPSASDPGELTFMETLLPFFPLFSRDLFTQGAAFDQSSVLPNVRYAERITATHERENYFNALLRAGVLGALAQKETSYEARGQRVEEFYALLRSCVDRARPPWQTLDPSPGNSVLAADALLILSVITSVGGLGVYGGINEARFYYEEFGVRAARASSTLPRSWKALRITRDGAAYGLLNRLYYTNACLT